MFEFDVDLDDQWVLLGAMTVRKKKTGHGTLVTPLARRPHIIFRGDVDTRPPLEGRACGQILIDKK